MSPTGDLWCHAHRRWNCDHSQIYRPVYTCNCCVCRASGLPPQMAQRIPHKCPVCDGTGMVESHRFGSSDATLREQCHACGGACVIGE